MESIRLDEEPVSKTGRSFNGGFRVRVPDFPPFCIILDQKASGLDKGPAVQAVKFLVE